MNKAILVMEMPEGCWQCNLHNYHYCDVTGKCINEFMNTEHRPDWCPLESPPKHMLIWNNDDDWSHGYNACLDEIIGKDDM